MNERDFTDFYHKMQKILDKSQRFQERLQIHFDKVDKFQARLHNVEQPLHKDVMATSRVTSFYESQTGHKQRR